MTQGAKRYVKETETRPFQQQCSKCKTMGGFVGQPELYASLDKTEWRCPNHRERVWTNLYPKY